MMKIELWIDDENYKDIAGFLCVHGEYYTTIWGTYYLILEKECFLTFLRELHSYLNNKDNWAEFFSGWEPIQLIIDFDKDRVVSIKVYDRYQ